MKDESVLGKKEDVKEILERLGIKEGDKPVDNIKVPKYDFKYKPSDFSSPYSLSQYVSTLGRCEWEMTAAEIVMKCQKHGDWRPIKSEELSNVVEHEMIEVGFLHETEEGYMLTQEALDHIYQRYHAS